MWFGNFCNNNNKGIKTLSTLKRGWKEGKLLQKMENLWNVYGNFKSRENRIRFYAFFIEDQNKKLKKRRIFRPFITSVLPLLFRIFYQSWCNIWGCRGVERKKWTAATSLMCEGLLWCNIKTDECWACHLSIIMPPATKLMYTP